MIINNSAGRDNWSQLRNINEPFSTCNVTACINGAQSADYDVMEYRKGLAVRPSDDLLLFIRSNIECNQLWKTLDPTGSIPINQWMAVLSLGLGKWLGNTKLATFEMAEADKMSNCIINGGACIISGKYETPKGHIDHITALVGVVYDSEKLYISDWIMDDSYGDYRTKYELKVGNDILMPYSDFIKLVKEQNSKQKRCIFIPKKGKV